MSGAETTSGNSLCLSLLQLCQGGGSSSSRSSSRSCDENIKTRQLSNSTSLLQSEIDAVRSENNAIDVSSLYHVAGPRSDLSRITTTACATSPSRATVSHSAAIPLMQKNRPAAKTSTIPHLKRKCSRRSACCTFTTLSRSAAPRLVYLTFCRADIDRFSPDAQHEAVVADGARPRKMMKKQHTVLIDHDGPGEMEDQARKATTEPAVAEDDREDGKDDDNDMSDKHAADLARQPEPQSSSSFAEQAEPAVETKMNYPDSSVSPNNTTMLLTPYESHLFAESYRLTGNATVATFLDKCGLFEVFETLDDNRDGVLQCDECACEAMDRNADNTTDIGEFYHFCVQEEEISNMRSCDDDDDVEELGLLLDNQATNHIGTREQQDAGETVSAFLEPPQYRDDDSFYTAASDESDVSFNDNYAEDVPMLDHLHGDRSAPTFGGHEQGRVNSKTRAKRGPGRREGVEPGGACSDDASPPVGRPAAGKRKGNG
ncbi:unnamed protein product [Amoebophrya sp. A120]|nr:unnamed protein product [Amoebophrya sp. A120]|eukprot:GSA120T00019372001.1